MNYQMLLTQMLEATLMSLRIFFVTLIFSLPLGLLVAKGRMSKIAVINLPVRLYILLMRGTPLMLQLLFSSTLSSPFSAFSLTAFWLPRSRSF